MMRSLKERKAEPETSRTRRSTKIASGRLSELKAYGVFLEALNLLDLSFVGVRSPCSYSANMVDRDLELLRRTPDSTSSRLWVSTLCSLYSPAMIWDGEAANRLARAHDEVVVTRRPMNVVISLHEELMGLMQRT
ncbi:pentatricopeptide repeat-containing protein mitochondrial-like [Dorcoceras hygrometricum]|uniref:Pentatricopeptide repeat-containing protein mitochondrial-like n=1 Tax=Dorcoceras hygrometricum TaxID=472368 RepID=A0A2Z7D1S5_9LAMI|nr:pentatricopeptide repeat-containing protein mitochondrial-like [Dorcoceras hygrometricum]